jgi:FSR family fosmidomycin resistance protein-like MFS transporter
MKKEDKFQTGNVITISIAHFVHDIFSSFIAPILPLLIDKHNISLSLAGFLTVVQRMPSLFSPLIGIMADKLPIRYILILAPSVTATAMSLVGLAPTYILLLILLLCAGIGIAFFHVPGPVMIKRVSGYRTGKGMSFFMFGGELARSVGPIVALGAVSLWGLEGTYRLIPVGLFASFLLYLRFRKIPISDAFKKREKESSIRSALIKHLPVFIQITGIIFFTSMIKSALTTFLPTYITSTGSSLWAGGISLAIYQLAGAVGTVFSGTISDKLGRRKTLITMTLTSTVLMWLYTTLDKSFAIPLLILLGIFMFAATPVLLAVINDIDSEHSAFLNGIFMTINFLFSGLAVVIVGVMGDVIGLELAYSISPLFGLLAIPFMLKLKESH